MITPSTRARPRRRSVRWLLAALVVVVVGTPTFSAPAQQVPARLADSTFWRLMNESSEPWGQFRSENLVSNETSLQWVIPELTRRVTPGSVYVGVAPDQNFTLIAALRPSIAFIVDIRHQNAMQHLMYKALFETSRTRAEFLATLFARAPLQGVDTASTAVALFDALAKQPADSARFRQILRAINERLSKFHGFALSDSERTSLGCVYGAFFTQGPELTYGYATECRSASFGAGYVYGGGGGGGGGGMGRGGFRMPNFLAMATEGDSAGVNRSYLGSERAFRAVKEMEERNLIVPLTGDFAGPKALRAVGQWARSHGAKVGAFYVSNVEQYLFQQDSAAARFYGNVATMPLDSTSMFVRSYVSGRFGMDAAVQFKMQSQAGGGRSLEGLSSIQEQLAAWRAGTLATWQAVIGFSHQ